MSKATKFVVDLNRPLPEWGVSQTISAAVPIAVSGAEIKSTRNASLGMHTVLRARIREKNLNDVAEVQRFVAGMNKKTRSTPVAFSGKKKTGRLKAGGRKPR
jgi:hypothetical protein